MSKCGIRFKAEEANKLFTKELKKYIPKLGMTEAYKHVLKVACKVHTQTQRDEIKDINDKIENAYNEITKARKLLLKEEIDSKDFKEIEQENENNIQVWEAKLMEASKRTSNIELILGKALNVLSKLDQLYIDGDMKMKRAIIGSIYPEKLTFDGSQYRATRINEAVRLIYLLDKGWDKNKTGQTKEIFDLSRLVPRTGQLSNQLFADFVAFNNLPG